MTEPFTQRESLRALREDVAPRRDLWAGIEQALDRPATALTEAAPTGRGSAAASWILAAGLAAMTILILGVAGFSSPHGSAAAVSRASTWQPRDPRLEGAAIELAAAQMELRLALDQAPSSPALRRLLLRTRQQQARLQAFEQQTG